MNVGMTEFDKLKLAVIIEPPESVNTFSTLRHQMDPAVTYFDWTTLATAMTLEVLHALGHIPADADGIILTSSFLQHQSDGALKQFQVGSSLGEYIRRYLMETEQQLQQQSCRQSYFQRLYAARRFQKQWGLSQSQHGLMEFQRRHKYLIMAYSPKNYKRLGKIAASPHSQTGQPDREGYFSLLMEALSGQANRTGHTNSLMHIQGYFKQQLNPEEKQHLTLAIDDYRNERVSLHKIKEIFRGLCRRYPQPYIEEQVYLHILPEALLLD